MKCIASPLTGCRVGVGVSRETSLEAVEGSRRGKKKVGVITSHDFIICWGNVEAYSAAGEIGFGWWLVEHYLSYHVNCPDGCVSG